MAIELPHRGKPPALISDVLYALEVRGRTWCYVELTENGGFSMPPNNVIMFYLVLNGSVGMTCAGGATVRLNAGDGAFAASGEAHALRVQSHVKVRPLEFLQQERGDDIPSTFEIGDSGTYGTRLLCGRLRPTWPEKISRPMLPPLLPLYEANAESTRQALPLGVFRSAGFGPGATVLLTRLASAVLCDVLRHELLHRRAEDTAGEDRIGRAVELVELKPGLDWNVHNLAQSVGMGRSNFSALFSRRMGKSPMEFVTETRMRKAAQLVRDSRMDLADISEALGYGCDIAFGRRFTRHFGMSPAAMRARSEDGKEDEALSQISLTVLRGKVPKAILRHTGGSTADRPTIRLLKVSGAP